MTFGYKLYLIVNYKCIQSIMKHNHSKKNFTNREEEFEDTKGILRIIEEEETTQWPKEKGQKDKQRSTKYMHKTKFVGPLN